jgi:short-subunit dehydrogenase
MPPSIGVGVVLNNASYGMISAVDDTDLSAFPRAINTNRFGTIILTRAVIPILRGAAL